MSRDIINDWFDAFKQKDITILERILADDFVHSSPFGDILGGQKYLDLVRANTEAFFSPTLDILDIIGNDEKFAVRYTVNGNPACDCIYTTNGTISHIHSYYHFGPKPNYDSFDA